MDNKGKPILKNQRVPRKDDEEILSLYFDIANNYLREGTNDQVVQWMECPKLLRKLFDSSEKSKRNMVLLSNDSSHYKMALAYISDLNISSVIAYHFRKLIETQQEAREKLLKTNTVKICSFQCSSGDIVAIVMVLRAFKPNLRLQVSVIDTEMECKDIFFTVLRCVEQFFKVPVCIKFHLVHSSKVYTRDVIKLICEADIVTSMKCFSTEAERNYMCLNKLNKWMKPSAILLKVNRTAYQSHHQFLRDRHNYMKRIYKKTEDFQLLRPILEPVLAEDRSPSNQLINKIELDIRFYVKVERETDITQELSATTQSTLNKQENIRSSFDSDDDCLEMSDTPDSIVQLNMRKGKINKVKQLTGMKKNYVNTQKTTSVDQPASGANLDQTQLNHSKECLKRKLQYQMKSRKIIYDC